MTVSEINMGSISRTWESEAWKNGILCRYAVRQMLFILMANMFVVPLFGCVNKDPVSTDNTAVPASPEECMTRENLLFYYSEAVVATDGGNGYEEYTLYKYTDSEVILVKRSKSPNRDATKDYRTVPVSVLDDCLKLAKKYKLGKGKWTKNGSGIVGMVYEIGFVKDGEYIHVSSECMPDNGMDAFDAVIKVLGKAWNN